MKVSVALTRITVLIIGSILCIALQAQPTTNISSGGELQQYWQTHKNELKVEKNSVEISTAEVPSKLQKTLNGNALYKGWKNSPLYFDKNTNLYTLFMKKDSTVVMYGFNPHGKSVSYDAYTVRNDQ